AMLSELYHIALNLKKQGHQAEAVHADFGEPGLSTNVNLRLLLGDAGTIVRLDCPSRDDLVGLWTLKKGNFKYFPAIRLPNPLLTLSIDDPVWNRLKKPTAKDLRSVMSAKRQAMQPVMLIGEREQAERMKRWTHEEAEVIQTLHAFANSFIALTNDPKAFSEKLAAASENALAHWRDEKSLKNLAALLCGIRKEPKNKPAEIEFALQLILDYVPTGAISGALYHPKIERIVLGCLEAEAPPSGTRSKKAAQKKEGICSVSGEMAHLLDGPFPDWSAKPIIAKPFKPYSKFSDAPCNARYHNADSDGFAIGAGVARQLVAAGSELTKPERRDQTWRRLRNGKFDERNGKKTEASDVLIAYPTFDWSSLASPVSIFGKPDRDRVGEANDPEGNEEDAGDDSARNIETFTQVAEPFCKALTEGASREDLSRDYIRLLILRQISPGQVQLAYSATPSREHFANAISAWMASANNLPSRLRFPLPSKKAPSGFGWYTPRLLFPEDAIRAFSHQWTRGGAESTRLQSPAVSDILDIFLRKEGVWEDTADRLLEILLPRVEPLIAGAGNILHRLDHQNPDEWRDFIPKTIDGKPDKRKPDPRYYLIQSISFIGTLLHALNSKKDTYMNESPFLLGKLLAIMDELHKCYCIDERKGDIPPTLIGNGLLGRAADSPEQALQDLCERSRIYLGWAKTGQVREKTPETNKIAIYSAYKLLRLAEPIADSLRNDASLSHPLDAQGKAHLFLGYLSPVLGGAKPQIADQGQRPETSGASVQAAD
ncbi:MAG: hypothetical protein H0T83_02215, partial [Chthoniobacterales bacterium]|nr:hypothetical protein [Chthoniobacterales bacterium]